MQCSSIIIIHDQDIHSVKLQLAISYTVRLGHYTTVGDDNLCYWFVVYCGCLFDGPIEREWVGWVEVNWLLSSALDVTVEGLCAADKMLLCYANMVTHN